MSNHYDWVIVGSGFGGSVSALRLTEKGYRVLVIEKGRRFGQKDFPKTNWDLKRWMWMPAMGLKGIFQMSFLDHVTILHGVGVGGGSLVYANTLPTPTAGFFLNPVETEGDRVLGEIARDIGREEHHHPTEVAVFFGKPGEKVPDPYFDGKGPERVGCDFCGACMTGCRKGSKNTLDLNYLYLAEKDGCRIEPETEVTSVSERDGGGYEITTDGSFSSNKRHFTADKVVFAGGVMGTLPLLLKLKNDAGGLPRLSNALGKMVRTNSEALIAIASPKSKINFTKGVAITSILHTDEHSHIEPVRYGEGSGFFRTMTVPHAPFPTLAGRVAATLRGFASHPIKWAQIYGMRNPSRKTQILLYMRTLEGTLSLDLGRSKLNGFRKGLVSKLDDPKSAPAAFIAEASDLARRFAEKVGGSPISMVTETLLGTPTTAHILGGCTMGSDESTGVIDKDHQVFGYPGLYVIDGAAMSANPGVNPSLTITAMAERAMSLIPRAAE
jgi:cholesterol oxidase